jgi:hypothetical protein
MNEQKDGYHAQIIHGEKLVLSIYSKDILEGKYLEITSKGETNYLIQQN